MSFTLEDARKAVEADDQRRISAVVEALDERRTRHIYRVGNAWLCGPQRDEGISVIEVGHASCPQCLAIVNQEWERSLTGTRPW